MKTVLLECGHKMLLAEDAKFGWCPACNTMCLPRPE